MTITTALRASQQLPVHVKITVGVGIAATQFGHLLVHPRPGQAGALHPATAGEMPSHGPELTSQAAFAMRPR